MTCSGGRPSPGRFSGRQANSVGVGLGEHLRRSPARSPSNGGPADYSAWRAHRRARDQARRPKPCKLLRGPLLDEVTRRLSTVVTRRDRETTGSGLPRRSGDAGEPRATIYQSLFVQGPRRAAPGAGPRPALGTNGREERGAVERRKGALSTSLASITSPPPSSTSEAEAIPIDHAMPVGAAGTTYGTGTYDGPTFDRWQYEAAAGGRIVYFVDDPTEAAARSRTERPRPESPSSKRSARAPERD